MSDRALLLTLVLALLFFATDVSAQGEPKADETFFTEHVAPIFERSCLSCHNDKNRKGAYSLQTAPSALVEGIVEPGAPAPSYFLDLRTGKASEATGAALWVKGPPGLTIDSRNIPRYSNGLILTTAKGIQSWSPKE